MTAGQDGAWAAGVARAFVDLSNSLLALGCAVAGFEAMAGALDREVEGSPLADAVDGEDPAGVGVEEDPRRAPEDADPWHCPEGLADADCEARHDHFPPPPKGTPR